MILEKLDLENNQDVEFLKKVFLESFPPEEKRPLDILFDIYKTKPHFTIDIAKNKGDTIGLLCYWDLADFIFGEYFAIAPDYRNGGNGKIVFQEFLNKISAPLIIEVELPTTEIAKRRIGFYERLGLKGWEKIKYKQPPYYEGAPYVPMMLMSLGEIDVEGDIHKIVDKLYSTVYDVRE